MHQGDWRGMVLISLSSHYSSMYLTMLASFGLLTLLSHNWLLLKGNPYRLFICCKGEYYCMCTSCYTRVSFLIYCLVHTCPGTNYKFRLHTWHVPYELYTYMYCAWLLIIDDRLATYSCWYAYTFFMSVCVTVIYNTSDIYTIWFMYKQSYFNHHIHVPSPSSPVPCITMGSGKMSSCVSWIYV